jgi:hypothetical protein
MGSCVSISTGSEADRVRSRPSPQRSAEVADGLRRAGIAGHPHSQPNSRYRCFLPDLTGFTRFVIERDPAIAARDKAYSTLVVSSEGVNHVPGRAPAGSRGARATRRLHSHRGRRDGGEGGI